MNRKLNGIIFSFIRYEKNMLCCICSVVHFVGISFFYFPCRFWDSYPDAAVCYILAAGCHTKGAAKTAIKQNK